VDTGFPIGNATNIESRALSGHDPCNFRVNLIGKRSNVYGDSDVDVVIRLDSVFYTDLSYLSEEDKTAYNAQRTDATYSLRDFKKEVTQWLEQKYGLFVSSGSKAISVTGVGSRRNADILVAVELRRYHKFKSLSDQSYHKGICFFESDGTRIDNFPTQHSDNCTTKHQATKRWFKHTVRIFKNMRNKLIEDGRIEDGLAPSYFLEGLLYNVPIDRFGGGHSANFNDVLNWLVEADWSKFECANELYYLFHATSPVTWRKEHCDKFLTAAQDCRNRWS
jgi:hypothetical protein